MSQFSNTIFLLSIFIIYVSSLNSLKESSGISDRFSANPIYNYINLLQYVTPTVKYNLSYYQCKLNEFAVAYSEIKGLKGESCINSTFDARVAELKKIIQSGNYIDDSVSGGSSSNSNYNFNYNESLKWYTNPVLAYSDQYLLRGDETMTTWNMTNLPDKPKNVDVLYGSNGSLIFVCSNAGKLIMQKNGGPLVYLVEPPYAHACTLVRVSPHQNRLWYMDDSYTWSIGIDEITLVNRWDTNSLSRWRFETNVSVIDNIEISPVTGYLYVNMASLSPSTRYSKGTGQPFLPYLDGYLSDYNTYNLPRFDGKGHAYIKDSTAQIRFNENPGSGQWKILTCDRTWIHYDFNDNGWIYAISSNSQELYSWSPDTKRWTNEGYTFVHGFILLPDNSIYVLYAINNMWENSLTLAYKPPQGNWRQITKKMTYENWHALPKFKVGMLNLGNYL